MIECVVNVSEGRDHHLIGTIAAAGRPCLLDVHSDDHHNRSVITLGSADHALLLDSTRQVCSRATSLLSLPGHTGVHPRIGVVDVVPFVPLEGSTLEEAIELRDRFARWSADELGVPCFLYGPERDLPTVRRGAFVDLIPDTGPSDPHPTAGAMAVGARPVLVAYNVWLDTSDLALARRIARDARGPSLRALGFPTGELVQVSCNLIDPMTLGPDTAYDTISGLAAQAGAAVDRAELVGLLPRAVLAQIPADRWAQLDLDDSRTIEYRLARL